MASWKLGFWFSPKRVWCCSSQGETESNIVPPVGCQVYSAGEQGERLSQLCSCPSTNFHHIVLLWHTGSGFHSPKTWYPTCYFYQLFSPLLPTTYIIIFAPWKKTTHLHNSSCPPLSWASEYKAAGKKPDSSMSTAGSCQPKPSACSEFSDSNTLSLGEGNAGKVTCMS